MENIDVFIDDKEKALNPLHDARIRWIKMVSHENDESKFETVTNWNEVKKLLIKEYKRVKK